MSVEEYIQKAINDKELYLIGEFPPKDWEQVFNLSLPLAKAGDVKAQFNVGYSYAKGEVIDQDFPKALEWYQKAADQNDPRAHYNLSLLYESGLSGLQNSMKAKEHYDRSLELGDDRSKIKTAFANAKEAFKRGDRDQARELFTIAEASIEEAKAGIIAC